MTSRPDSTGVATGLVQVFMDSSYVVFMTVIAGADHNRNYGPALFGRHAGCGGIIETGFAYCNVRFAGNHHHLSRSKFNKPLIILIIFLAGYIQPDRLRINIDT